MFGRSDDEWDSLVDNAITVLKDEAARKGLTSYSDLNSELMRRSGEPGFDFSTDRDRTAMGRLLGEVVTKTLDESGAMLSAIVAYIDRNDAGPGFYTLAVQLGLLAPTATSDDKLIFWSGQVAKIHNHYARPRRPRGR